MYRLRIRTADFVTYVFIIISSVFIIIQNYSPKKSLFVYFTLFVIGCISFIGATHNTDTISIKRTVNIFSYIFLFIAPWQQYSYGVTFWKGNGLTIRYTDEMYIKANLLVITSLAIFNYFYGYFKFRKTGFKLKKREVIYNETSLSSTSELILVGIGIISFSFIVVTGKLTGSGIALGRSALNSQLWNMIRFFPICAIIAYGMTYKTWNKLKKRIGFIFLAIITVVIYFPFWGSMSRFLMLGAYVVILALFKSNGRYKSWYFLMFFIGFTVLFSGMRHATSVSSVFSIMPNFNHVDFDAHQLLMATIQYTDTEGVSFLGNIISSLAFIIPRSIWSGKMQATGSIVTSYFGSWFTNVSSPLFGELYFGLGWLGVVFGCIFLAYIIAKIDKWSTSGSVMKRGVFCIVVGMTIYICRGSLLPTMAYTLGLILAHWVISKVTRIQTVEIIKQK